MEEGNAFEEEAVAREREGAHLAYIRGLGPGAEFLIGRVLSRPVTLKFRPDRYAANGRTVTGNLRKDGAYPEARRRPKYGALNMFCDLGDDPQFFRYFKQIWHTAAFFGGRR